MSVQCPQSTLLTFGEATGSILRRFSRQASGRSAWYWKPVKRRAWILGGALVGSGLAARSLYRLWRPDSDLPVAPSLSNRVGPLALPDGFDVTVIDRAGSTLSDGTRSAELPDGMACFPGENGEWVLMRNHELMWDGKTGAYPDGQPQNAYNPRAHGGVSRLVLDATSLKVQSSNMVVTGTLRNCGGGPSPWGWITCEEAREEGHGYAFLCETGVSTLAPPRRLTGYGRYRHEAVAVDPESLVAYLTEDEGDGCLYRFTPDSPENPFEGKLEALRVPSAPHSLTKNWSFGSDAPQIDWVPIEDPEAKRRLTRHQGKENGAATFARGEGIWFDGDGVVFAATSGGRRKLGQVFRLDIRGGRLTLLAESESEEQFSAPDNITVAPFGDLVLAEDNRAANHLRGLRRDGGTYAIARNMISRSEFTGVCFSPDGSTLFTTLQTDGLTLAIRGPFEALSQGAKSI